MRDLSKRRDELSACKHVTIYLDGNPESTSLKHFPNVKGFPIARVTWNVRTVKTDLQVCHICLLDGTLYDLVCVVNALLVWTSGVGECTRKLCCLFR